jgi:hypothetical protein
MSNITSQGAIYWQDIIHGSVELSDVEGITVTDNRGAEVVFNANGQPIGVKFTPGAFTISMPERKTTTPKVNWWRLRAAQIPGLLIVDEEGSEGERGRRMQFKCSVAKADESNDNQGEQTRTIELVVTSFEQVRG